MPLFEQNGKSDSAARHPNPYQRRRRRQFVDVSVREALGGRLPSIVSDAQVK